MLFLKPFHSILPLSVPLPGSSNCKNRMHSCPSWPRESPPAHKRDGSTSHASAQAQRRQKHQQWLLHHCEIPGTRTTSPQISFLGWPSRSHGPGLVYRSPFAARAPVAHPEPIDPIGQDFRHLSSSLIHPRQVLSCAIDNTRRSTSETALLPSSPIAVVRGCLVTPIFCTMALHTRYLDGD